MQSLNLHDEFAFLFGSRNTWAGLVNFANTGLQRPLEVPGPAALAGVPNGRNPTQQSAAVKMQPPSDTRNAAVAPVRSADARGTTGDSLTGCRRPGASLTGTRPRRSGSETAPKSLPTCTARLLISERRAQAAAELAVARAPRRRRFAVLPRSLAPPDRSIRTSSARPTPSRTSFISL